MRRIDIPGGILVCLLLAIGCMKPVRREPLRSLGEPAGGPVLLAIYEPWFGEPQHIDVGYSCHDPEVLRRQISHAKDLNIGGFVVNWYGSRKSFEDKSLELLEHAAWESDFKIAVQYDEAPDRGAESTDAVIGDLTYLDEHYIRSAAGSAHDAYLRYNGRPVLFIFPKDDVTDWNRVREAIQSWPDPPLLIYKDANSKYPGAFDGYYAWVQPGKEGWAPDGSHHGEDYLEHFYKEMIDHHADKLAVGALWPGFDDSKASWSRNRHMSYGCGKTFEQTLHIFHKFYGAQNSPPYLLVVTWNDYEEGTDVERGVSHCGHDGSRSRDTANGEIAGAPTR